MKTRNFWMMVLGMLLAMALVQCDEEDDDDNYWFPSGGGGSDSDSDTDSDSDSDTDSDSDSDTDTDGDTDIDGVPDGVNDFMSQDDVDALTAVGMIVHFGDNPPDLTGTFYADTRYTFYDDMGYEQAFVNATYEFYNQTADGRVDMKQTEEGISEGTGVGSFISGDNDCFTVWQDYQEHSTYNGDDCYAKAPVILSGCVDTDGISGFQFGFIMKSREGVCDNVVEEGYKRIIYETDDLVARQVE